MKYHCVVDEPAIYENMPADFYHADPAPAPGSLSSTGAHLLATTCPAVFAYRRANPERKRVFDVGTASHLMVLEPEKLAGAVSVVGDGKGGEAEDYRTKAARDNRDAIYEDGKVPLLRSEMDTLLAMREALWTHPIGSVAFRDGKPEQSIFWRDAEFGCWRRSRPDWMPASGDYLINWKTAASADPEDIQMALWRHGYAQKCEWEMSAVEAVTGRRPAKFCLLVQAKTPPYPVTPVWVRQEALEWGRILNRRACSIFAWCSEHNSWPGYQADLTGAPTAFEIGLPRYAEIELQRRLEAGELEPLS